MYTNFVVRRQENKHMKITHEADYAIRVMYCLAAAKQRLSARELSEQTGVTLRFSLKILRKLIAADLVQSFKGVTGGYLPNRTPAEISLGEIIECIDGPIAINHCLSNEFTCTHVSSKQDCNFHQVFDSINTLLRNELYSATLDQFTDTKKAV